MERGRNQPRGNLERRITHVTFRSFPAMPRTQTAVSRQSAIPAGLKAFIWRRFMELKGVALLAFLAALTVMLATWSANDPSWSNAADGTVHNALGYPGAVVADKLVSWLALANAILLAIPAFWAIAIMTHNKLGNWQVRAPSMLAALLLGSTFLSLLPIPSVWPLGPGLGGAAGDALAGMLLALPRLFVYDWLAGSLAAILCLTGAIWAICLAIGIAPIKLLKSIATLRAPTARIGHKAIAASSRVAQTVGTLRDRSAEAFTEPVATGSSSLDASTAVEPSLNAPHGNSLLNRLRERQSRQPAEIQPAAEPDGPDAIPAFLTRTAPLSDNRIEPRLERSAVPYREPAFDAVPHAKLDQHYEEDYGYEDETGEHPQPAAVPARVQQPAKPIKQGKRIARDMQPSLIPGNQGGFELPPLSLLAEPDASNGKTQLSADALEQNARMLEGVLEDFGIRGEIINVRPGPVVTLYELEPAPGIKSSRVIGLADDIARSMSAISVRVAVVPGRNVIGIEMPNSTRETVFLRELLASQDFEKTKHKLCMALGKDIGGEPSFADLARMPHLLIAGTTGSGKSVGINTMILSLLFRLPPDKCKLIMIDPKMLELSVYEGIPHLLAPVVTDPHKAVVSLKWAVREMEDRYRKMSKLGVRNIDGYNARAEQAQKKGEVFSRQIQTGFDPETGTPIYEEEQMDLSPMPYIVVIIDEMADLMMVAGKDIEGAVQRLAQMARAAGIHVIMATQRPSVDVITGTIKANFPTRISFQVTSKIDSRTILGEQGAEQLLGQGDMLYMAGGGRISRLHGPFVSDDEVEQIVAYLKTQAAPEYIEAVTEDSGEFDGAAYGGEMGGSGGSGDDLYDQAVAVILRDRKVSTSYIQRRLSIGYNKAASLIERMEQEGLISGANHAGKREILAGSDGEG
jgi:DNA segregation ATPase FtsK/SpoIIIE, S-DNA-T family